VALQLLTSQLLNQLGVTHGFTTAKEGISYRRADKDSKRYEEYVDNIKSFFKTYVPTNALVLPMLESKSQVVGLEKFDGSFSIPDVDAVVSAKEVTLALPIADCVPVLLFDKKTRNIGLVHAGWRGLAGQIVNKSVTSMIQHGSKAKDTIAVLGPAICVNCYEVGEEVAKNFDEQVINRDFDKPHIDLQKETLNQLRETGVPNIEDIGICTFENVDRFYSARASGETGRFMAFISNR